MKNLTSNEYSIVSEIINRVLLAYNQDGKLVDDYYENIILENLSQSEINFLKDF